MGAKRELKQNKKVLFVCSGNSKRTLYSFQNNKPFVYEQRKSLVKKDIIVDVFLIKGYGLIGYLRSLSLLRKKIRKHKYDLIHAHYGLSGMLCVLQRKTPVIISYLGSDIMFAKNNIISSIAGMGSRFNIFVSETLYNKIFIKPRSNYCIIPYGVDLNVFQIVSKIEARRLLKFSDDGVYVLFSSNFANKVKNYPLAKQVLNKFNDVNLLELGKGYSRDKINLLMNASDLVLITSFSEGSPQIIKEAMACNCPIVSTDVGDVKEVIGNTEGCYICSYDPEDVADKIKKALDFGKKTNGREKIKHLDQKIIAQKIIGVYNRVLDNIIP